MSTTAQPTVTREELTDQAWWADNPNDGARRVLGPELWETCGPALTEIAESALLRYGAPL